MGSIIKNLFAVFILFYICSNATAQDSLWCNNYGGYYNDNGYSILRLSNGDLMLLGSTYSYGSGNHDIYLVKVDSTGGVLWTQTYGGAGIEYGYDIQETTDNGFIIVGSTTSYGAGGSDAYMIKINSSGIEQWSQTYGGSQDDEARSVRVADDSGFIVCGTTSSFGTGTDIYLIKTDTAGDSTWTKYYGGISGESGTGVRVASDSGYIIIGSTGSYGSGYSSVYLIRTGDTGDTSWTATYGGARADLGFSLEETSDKGFILAGATAPDGENFYDAYVVKIDSLGTLEWDSAYGGSFSDMAYCVKQTSDGGFIIGGISEVSGARKIDVYMIKTDAAGAIEWDSTFGGAESDYCRSLIVDPDGNYYSLGYTFSYTTGGADFYLMKTGSSGGTDADWHEESRPDNWYELKQNAPNPFNASTRIDFNLPRTASYVLTIYNILGQTVQSYSEHSLPSGRYSLIWDGRDKYGSDVASGIYFYQLTAGDFIETRKMVLIK